jgi:uncharacterized protein with HEPN domain
MLDAARAALSFTCGRTRDDLSADLMLQFALVRAPEIVGETAARVSERKRTGHPEIPWTANVGMRNRLAHGYIDVDREIVWRTVTESLPPLIVTLVALLSPPSIEP